MSADADKVLREVPYRGERWRIALSSYGGALRVNVWAFWQTKDGEWRPCSSKSGKGFIMPTEAMDALVGEWRAVRATIDARGAPGAVSTVK